MISGRPLVLVCILLAAWFSLLCRVTWKAYRTRTSGARRISLTIAGLCCSAVAVGALLALHLSWISPKLSQGLGVATIRILALLLFWPTLLGFVFSIIGTGRIRFFGLATCLATGLSWFTLAMGSAISMGAPMARHPTRFLIPKGYVGWIKIEYGRNAPPLEMSNGKYICRLPASGALATNSPLEDGWARDEYLYYSEDGSTEVLPESGWGGGGMIWAGSVSADSPGAKQFTESFYVGTEDQYHRNESQRASYSPGNANFH